MMSPADLRSHAESPAPPSFEQRALELYAGQRQHNALYGRFVELLKRPEPKRLEDIPFLPIRFFKTHTVMTGVWEAETVFTSSTTTGTNPGRHAVRSVKAYLENTLKGFAPHYGAPADWCILALLPSYLERTGSSLVAMTHHWMGLSKYPESGFFLYDFDRLADTLRRCTAQKIPVLLLGVSFALLDFAAQYPMPLPYTFIMETGGMKGKRREYTRAELHQVLRHAFRGAQIHSEYGMTELLSQAYCYEGSAFEPAPTLRAVVTEINDPFCVLPPGRTGVLNFIDLANAHTCGFIATEDAGRLLPDGRFEVLGRLDSSEMRGCNLLYE